VGTLHWNTGTPLKRAKKTITIKDEKKWGRGRKLEVRKSKRATEKTKQKQENTQKTQATKGGRKTKPERGKEQRPGKRERSGTYHKHLAIWNH